MGLAGCVFRYSDFCRGSAAATCRHAPWRDARRNPDGCRRKHLAGSSLAVAVSPRRCRLPYRPFDHGGVFHQHGATPARYPALRRLCAVYQHFYRLSARAVSHPARNNCCMGIFSGRCHRNDTDGRSPWSRCSSRRLHAISACGAGRHSRFARPAPQHRRGDRCACRNRLVSAHRLVHPRPDSASDCRRLVPWRNSPHPHRRHARAACTGRIASGHRFHHH